MASSDDLITPPTIDKPKLIDKPPQRKRPSGPRDPQMVRRGIYLSLAGLAPALVCAAVMGAQPIGSQPVVEQFHKLALGVMLVGFVVILYGVMHFDQER